jgi:FdhE protein
MTQLGALKNIGDEATPPYAVLPDPSTLFLGRSRRARALASGHVLEPYLNFVADLTEAQHDIQSVLPPAAPPSAAHIQQALEFGMPPLSRAAFNPSETAGFTLERLMEAFRRREMPKEAAAATNSVLEAPSERRLQMLHGALKDVPAEDIAERALVLAALQVDFARLAAALSAEDLRPIADGACPVCGSPPMTSSVVGWPKAHNTRFCACSLCGTMWNVVRIKCVLCSSTEGIAYQTIEGQPETVKAETCDKCESYVKILYQVNDHLLDPLSDDVATLGLDLLLANEGWRRGGQNPFLLGY